MNDLLLAALGGFAATLVDGALGMGFGPTSSTVLLSAGVSPVSTATTVNLAKIATGVVSGATHWRLGNIDRLVVARLAGFGSLGAVVGALLLARLDDDAIKPLLAGLLLLTGLRVLIRFLRFPAPTAGSRPGGPGQLDVTGAGGTDADDTGEVDTDTDTDTGEVDTDTGEFGEIGHPDGRGRAEPDPVGLSAVAAAGGLASGMAGSWGPVVTPYLLGRRMEPRRVIGSVNTAEVTVAVVAAGALLSTSSGQVLDAGVVAAMLGGGMVAAPLGARLVHHLPPRPLGLAMGLALVGTQLVSVLGALGVHPPGWALVVAALAALAWVARQVVTDARLTRRATTPPAGERPSLPAAAPSAGR